MSFDLDQELTKFLKQLKKKMNVHRSTLEEIESHLRDSIDAQTMKGASEKAAFNFALDEFGDASAVAQQFEMLTDNRQLTKWANQASYYFDSEVIMRIFMGAILGMFFILLGTLLEGGQVSSMIGLRPLAMVLGGALGALVIAYPVRSIKNSLLLAITGRQASKANYLQSANIFKSYGELLVLSSGVTFVIGVHHVLSNLGNPQNIGPGVAVGILGVLYCLLMKLFVCKPLHDSFTRRSAVNAETNLLIDDVTLSA